VIYEVDEGDNTENDACNYQRVQEAKMWHAEDLCPADGSDAALRELSEELLVKRENVQVLGPCDVYWKDGLKLFPFLVKLDSYGGSFDRTEVGETFSVPLSFFTDREPERYVIEMKVEENEDFPYDRIVGGKKYGWRKHRAEVLFYQYKEWNIWGLTAKIINSFVESLKK